jgi:hypothetical protein
VSEAEAAVIREGYDIGLKYQNEHVTANKIKTLHRKFNHKGEQVAFPMKPTLKMPSSF